MSTQPARMQPTIQFGDDFELDQRAYELRRSGLVLKLEPTPMEILLVLVEQRGHLVTREQIVERIWGRGAFLDTDNSINGAIRKIRQTLNDDPEAPRFIQTVTGKGYRFIADIQDAPLERVADELRQDPAPVASTQAGWPASARRWMGVLGIAATLAVVLVAYLQWRSSRAKPVAAASRVMLAVLPFENLTSDAGQEYFSDGLTEEMITQLGRMDPQRLGVIARTSVMHYKHTQESLDRIGAELGVQYVLEGSVRRDSDKIRVAAQLIQVKDQTHLWARQYDRELKDVLLLQGEIAREISDEIQISFSDHKPITTNSQSSLSPQAYEAYNLYLQGLYFWNKRTIEGFQEAIKYFQQAAEKDPNCARAYAGLADAYALIGGYSGVG